MSCELVWDPSGLLERYSGAVTGEEMCKANDRVASDPRFHDLR